MKQQLTEILARLVCAREQAGLSQTQASKLLGFATPSALSQIENGQRGLKMDTFLRLCEIYDVSQIWLLTGHNPSFDEHGMQAMLSQSNIIKEDSEKLIDLLKSLSTENHG